MAALAINSTAAIRVAFLRRYVISPNETVEQVFLRHAVSCYS